jgi:hypothetical protein
LPARTFRAESVALTDGKVKMDALYLSGGKEARAGAAPRLEALRASKWGRAIRYPVNDVRIANQLIN